MTRKWQRNNWRKTVAVVENNTLPSSEGVAPPTCCCCCCCWQSQLDAAG